MGFLAAGFAGIAGFAAFLPADLTATLATGFFAAGFAARGAALAGAAATFFAGAFAAGRAAGLAAFLPCAGAVGVFTALAADLRTG